MPGLFFWPNDVVVFLQHVKLPSHCGEELPYWRHVKAIKRYS